MIQTFFAYQNSAPNKSLVGFAGFHNHGNDQTILLTLLDPGFLETVYALAVAHISGYSYARNIKSGTVILH